MLSSLAVILAILAAIGQSIVCWRGIKNSTHITNPFPELPDDAFRKCADMVKKRYTFFFLSSLVMIATFLFLFIGWLQQVGAAFRWAMLGIMIGIGFLAFGSFERRKAVEILHEHKHDWKDFTQAIATHKI
jgi:hypothetical protein